MRSYIEPRGPLAERSLLRGVWRHLPSRAQGTDVGTDVSVERLMCQFGDGLMTMLQNDFEYFEKGKIENDKYWKRLGGRPEFKGATALDVGCGHGRLCIDMALYGAARVVGVDTNAELIEFANENLRRNFPHIADRVEFLNMEVGALNRSEKFDFIVSKDSFEHIVNPQAVLSDMGRLLVSGGRAYIGFGPLYNSFYGDHKRLRGVVPWGHLIIPKRILFWRLNRGRRLKIRDVTELGINGLSLSDYRDVFRNSRLSVKLFRVNCSDHPVMKAFNIIRRVRLLEEYFSHNLYCILEAEESPPKQSVCVHRRTSGHQ